MVSVFSLFQQVLDSLVVRIPACHAGGRGSIPRRGGQLFDTSISSMLAEFVKKFCAARESNPGRKNGNLA